MDLILVSIYWTRICTDKHRSNFLVAWGRSNTLKNIVGQDLQDLLDIICSFYTFRPMPWRDESDESNPLAAETI
jgi:hypothetical protein